MRFLIVKTSALGDIIHTYGVVSYLRKRFPGARIDWVVEKPFADLSHAHPDIDETIPIQSKEWRKGGELSSLREFRKRVRKHTYEAVFDLQGNMKSAFVTLQARSRHKVGFGLRTVPEWPNALCTHHRFNPPAGQNIREDYLSIVKQYFNDTDPTPIQPKVKLNISPEQQEIVQKIVAPFTLPKVLVCPGSAWKNKQMEPSALLTLLKRLEPCAFLFIWGNEEEKRQVTEMQKQLPNSQVIDRLKLPALQNLMGQVDLIVSMDSLPLHLAATTGTPTLSIFGPSAKQKYQPLGEQHFAYQGTCPYHKEFHKRCKILRTCPTGSCIRQLNGNEVFERYKTDVCS